jgi:hypothetical protein
MSIVNLIKRLFENYYGRKIIGGIMWTALILLVYKKRTQEYTLSMFGLKL